MQSQERQYPERFEIWTRFNGVETRTKFGYMVRSVADNLATEFNRGSAASELGVEYFVVDTQAESPTPRKHWARRPLNIAIIIAALLVASVGIYMIWHAPDLSRDARFTEYQHIPALEGGAR